ncbi:uncharacterized protein LOC128208212 isoform X2 [Mya arenaria]|uniref:uncharacterized protein LOC128208212 isoform X2 n=1 Tax=Mya arenaria TaxID=6604 RepID=UPI0022E73078|nr:uncharacterized protein LOC128208212 isoform X2 [Mya arenaria]
MPAYILPVEHTRASFLKPPDGLRFGNFDCMVHLPPPLPLKTLGPATQSFSSLNNQQIYKLVCEWYEVWRPWQQRVLLCGIVDRCSIRQVDMLATTLEPIRHRDYTVAVQHQYPTTPLKKTRDNKPGKKKKKKLQKKKKTVRSETNKDSSTYQRTLNIDGTLAGATTPDSVIDPSEEKLIEREGQNLQRKLMNQKQLSVIHQERTKDLSSADFMFKNVDEYAGSLASRIVSESIPQTVKIFDPSELYAQDLASTIIQEAMDSVGMFMEAKEKSMLEKTTKKHNFLEAVIEDKVDVVESNFKQRVEFDGPGIFPDKPHFVDAEDEDDERKPMDTSILDKYRKFKSPKESDKPDFYKMKGRPKSLVRILIPEKDTEMPELKRSDSPRSVVSRWSAVSHSTLSDMRYRLFGARALATPDYFKKEGATSLQGGMLHLRQGKVRKPHGVQSLPVPVSRLYKSVKWWPDGAPENKGLVKAKKTELGDGFKDQLGQIWKWLDVWEDYEKIALLKELLKLCDPEDLNFLTTHIQQRLRNTRDINRLPDKLLLYIFSFISADQISAVKRVCRRWRYLCATDDLWMVKCHELGLQEGIQNLDRMIMRAKGYRMVIDWKLAYTEIKAISDNMKKALEKKKTKPDPQRRTVEFKEQLEALKHTDESKEIEKTPVKSHSDLANPTKPKHIEFELEVHRGTLSAIHRKTHGDDDAHSVVSEDLQEFDREYLIQWDTAPERKSLKSLHADVTDTDMELRADTTRSSVGDEKQETLRRLKPAIRPGDGIVRRKKEMVDDAGADDAAYDIRPDLVPSYDIMGKAESRLSLQWQREPEGREEGEGKPRKSPRFVGEVRSVLRARKLQGHMSGITCVQYDRRRLISAGLDRVIRMWDIRSGRSLHKFLGHKGGVRCLRFYGNELATGSWDTTIMIWDLRNLCRQFILTDHSDSVTCLAMSADFMVSGSDDCTVRVWRRTTYFCCNVLRGHKMGVTSIAFDGSHVISASKDGTLRLSNIVTGDCVKTFTGHHQPIYTVSMKGRLILSGDSAGRVFFWNKSTGEPEAAIQAHPEPVYKLEYLSGRFFTASGDSTIREWDLVTMTSVRLLQGHKGPVKDLQVTSDRMVSCSEDGSIRIWDLFDPRKKTTEEEQIQQLHQECP